MSSVITRSRRRTPQGAALGMTPLQTENISTLRKSGTFHSPTSVVSDLCDPIVNIAFMPKRSQTCSEDLEDLVNDASVRRVQNLLDRFDRTISGQTPATEDSSILSDPEVLPVPSFMLDNTTIESDPMDIDSTIKVEEEENHHASDSGIGSSIGDSRNDATGLRSSTRRSVQSTTSSANSAITKSFNSVGSSNGRSGHELTKNAIRRIQEKIIKPILAEKALKDFHPLISDVPKRIGSKNISNLRDLEKTLIFLAPEFSASPASYVRFCETSIQCIHTTVDYLCERDQRLPTDRPYTNNYFLDLVEQIRRYAAIMAASRQREEAGEPADEMDYSPDEKLTVRGGLSHNGRPIELVREKNGKTVPIVEGISSDDAVAHTFASAKRALEDDEEGDDDDVMRSMARRRKSEKPGDVVHHCNSCTKTFKRPCDLTKHMKTHSRPWKCSEKSCKYAELGWPTEKERDRHVNDKHSANPPQFKCQYHQCPYVSKRESNCKQHMEKTHGYQYVRSKCNGRNKKVAQGTNTASPQTPLTPFLPTPGSQFQLSTPGTSYEASPAMKPITDFGFGYGPLDTPAMSNEEFEQYRRASITTAATDPSYTSGYSPQQAQPPSTAVSPDDILGGAFNFDTGAGLAHSLFDPINQQPNTPALAGPFDGLDFNPTLSLDTSFSTNQSVPHLSPAGQADMTLYSPHIEDGMPLDEGFDEEMNNFRPSGDFTLFDSTEATGGDVNSSNIDWFPMDNMENNPLMDFYSVTNIDDFIGGLQSQ